MTLDFFLGVLMGAGVSILALVVWGIWSDGVTT